MQGGEGRGSPGEAVAVGPGALGAAPGAGALAWRGSSPVPPSSFRALRAAADGRRGTPKAKVHPEVGVSLAGAYRIFTSAQMCYPHRASENNGGLFARSCPGPGCCWSPGPPQRASAQNTGSGVRAEPWVTGDVGLARG